MAKKQVHHVEKTDTVEIDETSIVNHLQDNWQRGNYAGVGLALQKMLLQEQRVRVALRLFTLLDSDGRRRLFLMALLGQA